MTLVNAPPETVADILQVVGEEIQARWMAIGTAYDDVHWNLGKYAYELIPELPAGLVYEAIGQTAGIDPQTVRKAYYTYRDTAPDLVVSYDVCFSIFQHAAKLPEKQVEILDYALAHKSSVRQIQALYPVVEDEDTEAIIKAWEYPRNYYGIIKEARLMGKFDAVKFHLDAIRELMK